MFAFNFLSELRYEIWGCYQGSLEGRMGLKWKRWEILSPLFVFIKLFYAFKFNLERLHSKYTGDYKAAETFCTALFLINKI